jgi:hypothetical protein
VNYQTLIAVAATPGIAWLAGWYLIGFTSGQGVTLRANPIYSLWLFASLVGVAFLAAQYLGTL